MKLPGNRVKENGGKNLAQENDNTQVASLQMAVLAVRTSRKQLEYNLLKIN
jgi:hypothetical protein